MPSKTWTLIDAAKDVYVGDTTIGPQDLGRQAAACKVRKRTLRGGLRDGMDVVEVENGSLRFTVLPQRGMGIWKAWLGDWTIGWNSPVLGPVHPSFVPIAEPSGLGWLNGFDELLCRCGLESNGAPEFDEQGHVIHPLHGKIANLPAHSLKVDVDDATGEIAVTGVVNEARLHFQKLQLHSTVKTRPNEAGFRIVDEIVNVSGSPSELQLIYHINIGPPALEGGSRLIAPVKTLVPRNAHAALDIDAWDSYAAERAGYEEQVYFFEPLADDNGQTRVLLRDAHGLRGVSLRFAKKQLPCFTQWKNTTAVSDGYVTGIEPGINFPNPRSFEKEHGRVVTLKPGTRLRFELAVEMHPTRDGVDAAEKDVARIQGDIVPTIHRQPTAGWAPT